jgi:hypothetical protein
VASTAAKAAPGKADAAATVTAPAMALDEILRRNADARGGMAAWQKVKALSFSGQLDAGRKRPEVSNEYGNPNASLKDKRKSRITRERELADAPMVQLPYTLELARGRKSRMEVVFQDKTAVQVYDGSNGWKLRPWLAPDRQLQAYSAEELKLASDQSDLDGWLLDAKAKGNKVEQEGVDAVDGKAAYKLKVTLPTGDVRHVWVDAESFLDVQVESARRFDGKLKPMYTAQKDFRTVDGIKLPFLMETRIEGGRDADRIVVEKVAVNPSLAANRFAKP